MKPKTCIPGNEHIIVDMKFSDHREKVPLFYVLHAANRNVYKIRFTDLKPKEIARLYVSEYILNTFGIEVVISETLHSICKKKEKLIIDKTKLMREMEGEDLK